MENAVEIYIDVSEEDDETDRPVQQYLNDTVAESIQAENRSNTIVIPSSNHYVVTTEMENAVEIDIDVSEEDDETDRAVQEYLNDTVEESIQAENRSNTIVIPSSNHYVVTSEMENDVEIDIDVSEEDDETDRAVQEYLNDTVEESIQAENGSNTIVIPSSNHSLVTSEMENVLEIDIDDSEEDDETDRAVQEYLNDTVEESIQAENRSNTIVIPSSNHYVVTSEMENVLEIDIDDSEEDDETDRAVQEYLNDTVEESIQAENRSNTIVIPSSNHYVVTSEMENAVEIDMDVSEEDDETDRAAVQEYLNDTVEESIQAENGSNTIVIPSSNHSLVTSEMENDVEIDIDVSEEDDEIDRAVQEYLNDPVAESIKAENWRNTLIYTPEQLGDIALYKEALARNRESEANYKKLLDCYLRMLEEVRRKLKENDEAIQNALKQKPKKDLSYHLRCSKPYFKDKDNIAAPDNEDTIIMRQAQMYDFSLERATTGWTTGEKQELERILLEFSRDIRKKNLRSEIARLKRENNNENLVDIARLEREILQLYHKTLSQIALPIDQDYDWEALANSLNRRHSANEYEAVWKVFLHPSINKKKWNTIEHQELKRIATAHNMQDWDAIAKELNTGRSGYQCFLQFCPELVKGCSNKKWTLEETEYLRRVINYYKFGEYIPWGKVASVMDNRTKKQVYNKYLRMTERRKGRFLEEEDTVLLKCFEKYGADFKNISKFLPGRSPVQLQTRYRLLTKVGVSTTWNIQEDRKLIQIMANQDSNSNFSAATKLFPGKDRKQIRSRYVTLMRWMKAHPATDLSMAPRRGARRLLHGHSTTNLREALTNLKKRIEMELTKPKKKTITINSSEEEIEEGIIALLQKEMMEEKDPEEGEISNSAPPKNTCPQNINNLRKMLIFLNASLNKNKFDQSKYAVKYPELGKMAPKVSLHKIKTYSKKQSVQTIELDESNDIWGNLPLGTTSYVLPPNYSTLTGCRVLMKDYGTKPDVSPEGEFDLSRLTRENPILRDALCKLQERFRSLFLWPMLLANEMPSVPAVEEIYVPRSKFQQICLPVPNEVAIATATKNEKDLKKKDTDQVNITKK